eukprot:7063337-Alexandrium_andersonii.AAC.1
MCIRDRGRTPRHLPRPLRPLLPRWTGATSARGCASAWRACRRLSRPPHSPHRSACTRPLLRCRSWAPREPQRPPDGWLFGWSDTWAHATL